MSLKESKRYYANVPSDMKMIEKFTRAYASKGSICIDGNLYTPKDYKLFPDGVRFDCEVSLGLGLGFSDQNSRDKRRRAELSSIL